MSNLKTISNADAENFPVLAPYVGEFITGAEWRKAVAGEKFTVGKPKEEKAEATEEGEAEATPKKVTKKSK